MSHRVRFNEPDSGTQLDVVDAVVTVKVQAPDTDGTYELFELEGAAGSGAPRSRHPWAEAYYVLEGTVDVQVGGRSFELEAGSSVTIPPNAAHSLVVTSDAARMLVLSLGAQGGRFFAEMDEHVHLADGPEVFVPRIAEVAERNEVTLLMDAQA